MTAFPPPDGYPLGPTDDPNGPVVLHDFRRGSRPFSLVVLREGFDVIQTAPGLRGLGSLAALAVSQARQKKLDQLAPQGPAAVVAAFPHGQVVPATSVAGVEVSSGQFGQRLLVIHCNDGSVPVKLPFARKAHTLAGLYGVFGPRLGDRFRIDPAVAAQG